MDDQLTDGIRVLARLSLAAEKVCADTGISLVQYRLLFVIAEEPQRAGRLAERLAVSRPTLTAAARSLEDRGFVLREPVAGDGRGVQLRLTDEGAAMVAEVELRILDLLVRLADPAEVRSALERLTVMREPLDRELARFHRDDAITHGVLPASASTGAR